MGYLVNLTRLINKVSSYNMTRLLLFGFLAFFDPFDNIGLLSGCDTLNTNGLLPPFDPLYTHGFSFLHQLAPHSALIFVFGSLISIGLLHYFDPFFIFVFTSYLTNSFTDAGFLPSLDSLKIDMLILTIGKMMNYTHFLFSIRHSSFQPVKRSQEGIIVS